MKSLILQEIIYIFDYLVNCAGNQFIFQTNY